MTDEEERQAWQRGYYARAAQQAETRRQNARDLFHMMGYVLFSIVGFFLIDWLIAGF